MLYQIHEGQVTLGSETILHNINFEIRNTEKIALVGRNGCGKTTLLKLISGEVELDKRSSDEEIYIVKSGNPEIGYLKQNTFEDDTRTVEEEIKHSRKDILELQQRMNKFMGLLMEEGLSDKDYKTYSDKYANAESQFAALGGYDYDWECDSVLNAFGFPESERKRPLSEFSGGQRTKIAFAKLLLSKPDILLLDEPTNHLDVDAIKWLERYLKEYPKAVVVVSHDRMFLDNVVDVVYEIEYGTAKRYPGNYTSFTKRKRENWDKQMKDFTMQQKEIERLSYLVEKFKHHPTKTSMAWNKQKAIDHMERIDAPDRYDLKSFHANCTPRVESGKRVLTANHLEIGYEDTLSEVSFEMTKGQKLAVIGANGTGKSTLLKTLVGRVPALAGTFDFGLRVEVGYFDQQAAQYNSEKTVLEDMWDEFPDMKETEVRSLLGSFLFSGDEVFKTVSMLSGGEKGRLALAKMFKRQPNLLILDEPTNHMDIVGKETLERMLKEYEGTLIIVSHDRYLVDKIADSLLVFEPDEVTYFKGSYKEFVEVNRRSA